MRFNSRFPGYLDKLPLADNTRSNYRQYVRWMEQYGTGLLDLDTLHDAAKVDLFIDTVASGYDADGSGKRRKHKFNPYRKKDARTILRHYQQFLEQEDSVAEQQASLDKSGAFQPTDAQDGKEKVMRNIALRRGQPQFRGALLAAYGRKCAMTDTAVADVLEAAHIRPYNGPSTNHVTNGLLLRSDIHALFDLGLLSISPDTLTIYCSQQIRNEPFYIGLHGTQVRVPSSASQRPDVSALRTHFEQRVL